MTYLLPYTLGVLGAGIMIGSVMERYLERRERRRKLDRMIAAACRAERYDACVMDEHFVELPDNVVRGRFER